MPIKLLDPATLRTVSNYAKRVNRTPSHIYQLGKDKAIEFCYIDGVPFVDIGIYPYLPESEKKKRKPLLED